MPRIVSATALLFMAGPVVRLLQLVRREIAVEEEEERNGRGRLGKH